MTANLGYVPPTTEAGALGVHSLDQFVLAVPDANVAQDFYGNFGLDIERDGNTLAIKTFGHEHRWGSIVEGKTQGAASSLVRLLRRGSAAAQGAHRGSRRQTDRSATRLREQRLLVPQSGKRSDPSEGRAQGVARPQIGKQLDARARRHGRRRDPGEIADTRGRAGSRTC